MIKRYLVYFLMSASVLAHSQNSAGHLEQQLKDLGLQGADKIANKKIASKLIALLNNTNNPYIFLSGSEWEKLLEKQYQFALSTGDSYLKIRLSYHLAGIYHNQAKFDKNLPLLEFIHPYINTFKVAEQRFTLIRLEEVYRSKNEIAKAIEIRKERIAKKFINTFWEIYRDCRLYDDAIKDFKLFEPIPETGNHGHWFRYYERIGDLYFESNKMDSARKYFTIGANLAKYIVTLYKDSGADFTVGPKYWLGNLTGNIAKCDVIEGKYNKAIGPLLYDISLSQDNPGNRVYKYLFLADCYMHLNELKKAKAALDSSRGYIVGSFIKRDFLKYYQTFSTYYKTLGQYDSAFYYNHLYSNFADSLYFRVQRNQSVILLAKLEIDKRRNDLAISNLTLQTITSKSKIQQSQLSILLIILFAVIIISATFFYYYKQKSKSNKIIEQQNDRNELLLKELHHRVKNNMQLMYSLLNLEKRRIKDEDTKMILSSVQNRIHTMSLVHQNLYTTGNFEMVDLKSYVKTLLEHLQLIYKIDAQQLDLLCNMDDYIHLPIDRVLSIGLIINESVSNTFKYAFNKRPKCFLSITILKQHDGYLVEIFDDGPGFKEDQRKENSLGMKLIKVMCSQLKAKYTLTHKEGVKHLIEFE